MKITKATISYLYLLISIFVVNTTIPSTTKALRYLAGGGLFVTGALMFATRYINDQLQTLNKEYDETIRAFFNNAVTANLENSVDGVHILFSSNDKEEKKIRILRNILESYIPSNTTKKAIKEIYIEDPCDLLTCYKNTSILEKYLTARNAYESKKRQYTTLLHHQKRFSAIILISAVITGGCIIYNLPLKKICHSCCYPHRSLFSIFSSP